MNNLALVDNKNTQTSLWESSEDLKQIKEIYGKGLSAGEFNTLVQMGRATSLNPFLKEIWAVKYGDNPAQIFIGRDGYRKSAQRHPLYDYHVSDAVYSNDTFDVTNGEVNHKYNLKDRGFLVGAYCVVQRKGSSRPTYVFVELKEYSTNKSLWNPQTGKQATMIKKVAEAQGLRASFQELFSGTYSEFEEFSPGHEVSTYTVKGKGVNGLKEKLGIRKSKEIIFNESDEILDEIEEKKEHTLDLSDITFLMDMASSEEDLKEAANKAINLPEDDKKKAREIYNKVKNKLKS